jgi:hypothetical protein
VAYGVAEGRCVGVADGDGVVVALDGGFPPACGLGCEGFGVAMRINSDTVTNLKPFASSASKVEGIASIVPG